MVPTGGNRLIGEERDLLEKRATFFCVELSDGHLLWEEIEFGEPWWIGVEAVDGDRLYLHKFASPDMPTHRGIIAVDIGSGKVIWSSDALKFIDVANDTVVAARWTPAGEVVVGIDRETGNVVEEFKGGSAMSWRVGNHPGTLPVKRFTLPEPMPDVQVEFPEMSALVRNHCQGEHVIGTINALRHGKFLAFAYNEQMNVTSGGPLHGRSIMKILDVERNTIAFTETLGTMRTAIPPDPFFVLNGTLVYVKDQRVLAAIRLGNANP